MLKNKFLSYLAETEEAHRSRKVPSQVTTAPADERHTFDYVYHSSKEIMNLLAQRTEKTAKLVPLHKQRTGLKDHRVA